MLHRTEASLAVEMSKEMVCSNGAVTLGLQSHTMVDDRLHCDPSAYRGPCRPLVIYPFNIRVRGVVHLCSFGIDHDFSMISRMLWILSATKLSKAITTAYDTNGTESSPWNKQIGPLHVVKFMIRRRRHDDDNGNLVAARMRYSAIKFRLLCSTARSFDPFLWEALSKRFIALEHASNAEIWLRRWLLQW